MIQLSIHGLCCIEKIHRKFHWRRGAPNCKSQNQPRTIRRFASISLYLSSPSPTHSSTSSTGPQSTLKQPHNHIGLPYHLNFHLLFNSLVPINISSNLSKMTQDTAEFRPQRLNTDDSGLWRLQTLTSPNPDDSRPWRLQIMTTPELDDSRPWQLLQTLTTRDPDNFRPWWFQTLSTPDPYDP